MSDPIRERIDWLDDDDYADPLAAALRAVLDLCAVGSRPGFAPSGGGSWVRSDLIEAVIAEALAPPARPAPDYLPAHQFLGDEGRRCWWKNADGYMCCKSAEDPVHG